MGVKRTRFAGLRNTLCSLALLAPALLSAQTYGDRVDLYFADWHAAPAHALYGGLRAQDLLTPGDPLRPASKGAVLRFVHSFRHATLAGHAATRPIQLTDTQQIYFILSGQGQVVPAGAAPLRLARNSCVLAPAGTTITLRNTASQPLEMYVIEEPVTPGFHPNDAVKVRDEGVLPVSTTREQWSYIVKPIFTAADGLATLTSVSTIEMDALTIGRPQLTHGAGSEIVWTTIEGEPLNFVANEVRHQHPGTAFLEVPDGKTPHSAIDPSENDPVRFLVFARDPSPGAIH
jgi:mannose-6-phosphate isomerase-like protein (cupin superfamily)